MNTHVQSSQSAMPAIFVSHGSPDTAIADTQAAAFLRRAAADLPRPKAIVVASAHFEVSGGVAVTADALPETIHDFGGFQPELYQMRYPAPGEPDLANDIARRLTEAGFLSKAVEGRGFDHGVWVPLILMYPDADIPVVSVSVDPRKGPEHHFRLGRALAALASEGVLVIGSGSFTHNLPEAFANLRRGIRVADVPAWVSDFTHWMNARIESAEIADLLAYRERAPHAAKNHPTDEHLLPLYVALGAAGDGFHPEKMHESDEFGVLSMTMWRFDPASAH